MDIKQLSYFIMVANEGSLLRASKRLDISQPALSVAIKNLEQELGAPLFFTFGRKRELTDEGHRLLADAKILMSDYQKALDNVQRFKDNPTGQIRLGLPPLMGTCFFGDVLPSFARKYPNIKISIVEEGVVKIDKMIEDGDLDMALSLQRERGANFEQHHFTSQRNVVLVNEEHPLAHRTSLTVADLREERFVFFNENFLLHKQLLACCKEAGFFPKFSLLTSQWDFMVEVVSHNQGISILPKPIYETSPRKNIVTIPLTDNMRFWNLVIVWNKERYFSKTCEIFYKHMSKELPPDDPDLNVFTYSYGG